MKLEDQVISLELSIKLKELGIKQVSLYYWEKCPSKENKFVISSKEYHDIISSEWNDGHPLEYQEIYSAFLSEELLSMINAYISISKEVGKDILVYYQPEHGTDNSYTFPGDSLANLLAKVLIVQINEEEFKFL